MSAKWVTTKKSKKRQARKKGFRIISLSSIDAECRYAQFISSFSIMSKFFGVNMVQRQYSGVLSNWECLIKMRTANGAPILPWAMKEGECKKAALSFMKYPQFYRTPRYIEEDVTLILGLKAACMENLRHIWLHITCGNTPGCFIWISLLFILPTTQLINPFYSTHHATNSSWLNVSRLNGWR